ncbi:MAG: DUF1707 domain-containing protein [Solirubrobacteraceae bacterium MAG38_C4-C5]|nr:DUF1707 domain-containing protein [Candidatus Siliceabacter maunaloa]
MTADDNDSETPAVRASDAERERNQDLLRDAAAEGRLTFEELADRIEAAGRATTREELGRLTADLPVGSDALVPAAATAPAKAPAQSSSVFGDLRRAGEWTVPAASRWRTTFGDVVLDLREARVGAGETTIEAGTIFGDIQLLVPEGVHVEVRTRTFFGSVRQEAGDAADPGAPRVVLTGGTWFGDVRVRSQRLRERLAQRWRQA